MLITVRPVIVAWPGRIDAFEIAEVDHGSHNAKPIGADNRWIVRTCGEKRARRRAVGRTQLAVTRILNLLKDVPDELVVLTSGDYSELILAESAIEEHLAHWRARGNVGDMAHVKGFDTVTVIRRALAKCPDEYPPSPTTELLFIKDAALRENIRQDLGASNRALSNAEWKAATVLAGAAIEALLHWRLQEPSPDPAAIQAAVTALVAAGTMSKPDSNIDRWELHHSIEVAEHLNLLKPDTCSAARLARSFRNLIHPGRAARLAQTCDRATAYSAIGALGHVIRDLS